jgi:toxin YoeB
MRLPEMGWMETAGPHRLRSPFAGIGKAEPLRENLFAFWSSPIGDTNRLVYVVDGDLLTIVPCRHQY